MESRENDLDIDPASADSLDLDVRDATELTVAQPVVEVVVQVVLVGIIFEQVVFRGLLGVHTTRDKPDQLIKDHLHCA
jgi:hypothetical protein